MDDFDLIKRCATGDKQARTQFIEKYSRLIYNYIVNVLYARKDPAAQCHVNDVFQELFCFLLEDNARKLCSFQARNGCTLASWLRQVTVNFTIDYLRKIKPELSLDGGDDEGGTLMGMLSYGSASAADSLHAREQMENLKDCIEMLGIDDKYFIELHINRGLKLDEVKTHLGISRNALDVYKSRLMNRLRDCFRSKGYVINQ